VRLRTLFRFLTPRAVLAAGVRQEKRMKEATNRRRRGGGLYRAPDSAPIPARTRKIGVAVSIGAVLAATAIVVGSLYNIQIRNGEMYSRYASDQQLLDTTIQATRGEIYDATGKVLASTSVVWDIWCDPSYSSALYDSQTITSTDPATGAEVESTVRTLDAAACGEISRELTLRLLSGDGVSLDKVDTTSQAYLQQYEAVYEALSKIDSSYQVLAEKVNNAVKESIEQYVSDRNAIKGTGRLSLSSSRTYQRNYPYGAFAASVLGFTNADGDGFYGLEKSYDDILSGTDGRTVTIRNARGNAIADSSAVTYDAKDGDSLVLTLDTTIQEVVEKYLNEAIAANTVENRGCAIVMDVNTGGILAMASKPDFDPNDPNNYTANQAYLEELVRAEPELYGIYLKNEDGTFVTDENGNKILDPEADYSGYFRDIMWKNKNITELYYPGSVFKVITAAMGVDSGNATYNTTFNCSGAYAVAKQTYHCAGRHSHGIQNLADALLLNSCNIYFIQLGQRIGVDTFYDYFKAFGFTERTGVDLPNETGYMQYYTDQTMGEVELASSAFGQSMAVTPLQVCTAVSAAVNGGYLVTPHVVDQIVDANGNVVEQIGPNVRRQVISGSASETIRQIMEHEVGDGTTRSGGYRAYVAGYRIGGKSGTSELLNMDRRADGDYKKAASFVAVLPADDPQILVYVMLDDPNNANSDYSSVLAAPVVGNIISEIAPYLGIATDGVDRSGQTVKVPNLIGTEWSNAQVNLNIRGLAHHLVESESGNTAAPVTWQYPTAGTEVPSGTTIYLYTDTYSGQTAEVPDLTGKSADFASQMLHAAGFNCIVEGSAAGLVQSQSAAPGDRVQLGTIVTITCG